MLEGARAGKHVVHLKAGDPYLFGRGGDEVATLRGPAGIEIEVLPGVTRSGRPPR